MIKGRCRTNLDSHKTFVWPVRFAEIPKIGDRVATKDWENTLKVVSITHGENNGEPYIVVELNK